MVVRRYLEAFMGRVGSGSVVDLMKKGVVLVGSPEGAALQEREAIVDRLLAVMAEGAVEQQAGAAEILSELIGKFQAGSSGDHLIARVLSTPHLETILGHCVPLPRPRTGSPSTPSWPTS